MELKDIKKLNFVFQIPRHKNREMNIDILNAMEEILTFEINDTKTDDPFFAKMGFPLAKILNKRFYGGNNVFSPETVLAIFQLIIDNMRKDADEFDLNLLIEQSYAFASMFDVTSKDVEKNAELKSAIKSISDDLVQNLNDNKAIMEEKKLSMGDVMPQFVQVFITNSLKKQIKFEMSNQSIFLIAAAIMGTHNLLVPEENQVHVWKIGSMLFVWTNFIYHLIARLHQPKMNINGFESHDIGDETIVREGDSVTINLGKKIKK